MADLSSVLADIPGLNGYLASKQHREGQQRAEMDLNLQRMKLVDVLRGQQKEQKMRDVLMQHRGDPALSAQALLVAGYPEEAAKLHSLIQKPVPTKSELGSDFSPDTGMERRFLYDPAATDPTSTIKYIGGTKAEKPETPVKPDLGTNDMQNAAAIASAMFEQGTPEWKAEFKKQMISFSTKAGGGNPYSSPVYDEKGRLLSYNHRSEILSIPKSPFAPPIQGEVTPPVVGAKYSTDLQRDLTAATGEGKAIGEERGLLPNQKEASVSVRKAKDILSKGIYSGGYAKLKMAGAKYVPGVDTKKAARTEEFISHVGNTVVPRLKEFGGSDTVEEMNYLREIMGGNISLEEGALKAILDQVEAKIQRGIARVNRGMTPDGQPVQPSTGNPVAPKAAGTRPPLSSFHK